MSAKWSKDEQDVIKFLRSFQLENELLNAGKTLQAMGWGNRKATIRMVPAECQNDPPLTSDEEEYVVTIVDFKYLNNGKIRYTYVDEDGYLGRHTYDPVVEHERQQEKLEPLFRIHQ
jgi:hypothetical protein